MMIGSTRHDWPKIDTAAFERGFRESVEAVRQFAESVNAVSFCTECGQRKSPMDSSPCGACVARHVKEAEDAYQRHQAAEAIADATLVWLPGEGN